MTDRQQKLFEIVKRFHGDQKRKYTGDPYHVHLTNVAALVEKYINVPIAVDIALCHDLLEDTKCRPITLIEILTKLGYSECERASVINRVIDLTDVYTSEAYPKMNRKERKEQEAHRLSFTDILTQSIKYADLIDNTTTIVRYDPGFAKTYLAEKKMYLDFMRKGNIDLLILAARSLATSLDLLDALSQLPQPQVNTFCVRKPSICTMAYCDENGCVERKRNLVVSKADMDADPSLRPVPYNPIGESNPVPTIKPDTEFTASGSDLD